MLLTDLMHPEILTGLAGAGHGGQILLADGHYPAALRSVGTPVPYTSI